MGRPKNVSKEEILTSSMNLFWKQGYDNTSYDDIIKATGTSRYGLYHEFGDKEKLFTSVLDYYTEQMVMRRMKPLQKDHEGLITIKIFFQNLISDIKNMENRIGCLICNSTVYEAKHYPAIREQTGYILAKIQNIFRNTIKEGVYKGIVQKEALVDGLDGILLAQLISINVISPKADAEELLDFMLIGVNRLLDSYMT